MACIRFQSDFIQRGITPEREITRTRKKTCVKYFFHEESIYKNPSMHGSWRTDVLMRVQLWVAPHKCAPQNVVLYGHTHTDSICEVFSPCKCSLYTRPHKLRPTMDILSKLVQTSTFQTPPTPLRPSVEYVRRYRLAMCSSQVKISPQVMAVLTAQLTNTLSWERMHGQTDARTDGQSETNMPRQLLRSSGQKKNIGTVIAFLNTSNCTPFRWIACSVCLFVCLFVLGFYSIAIVFQSYNGGQLN